MKVEDITEKEIKLIAFKLYPAKFVKLDHIKNKARREGFIEGFNKCLNKLKEKS